MNSINTGLLPTMVFGSVGGGLLLVKTDKVAEFIFSNTISGEVKFLLKVIGSLLSGIGVRLKKRV